MDLAQPNLYSARIRPGNIRRTVGLNLKYIDCPFEKEYQKQTLCSLEKINKCLGYNPKHKIKDNIINLEKKLREYFKMPSYIFH